MLHSSWGGGNRRRMFTINLTRQGHTPDEVAMVDRYLKAHCPVAHGFKIGGMCESIAASPGSCSRCDSPLRACLCRRPEAAGDGGRVAQGAPAPAAREARGGVARGYEPAARAALSWLPVFYCSIRDLS